ncbi:MAG: sulfur carrier protein [Pseudonocardiales bacterium]|jgi:sulfur carrier protein|nr:sulfur carrier protein [Pseudonocardiales bacterium]MDT4960303.1 sulfur carrier protein [Pseudonocardiales bacterium]MDT4962360.1 sulfur carrier protein [Pseudonocardiales bacterium]MDT4970329.1 sulfur carrier protein [Pseudonocardiales bacterium]MDT4975206.1 sulfur carrier protein [Pseudonocardiales bacterium]
MRLEVNGTARDLDDGTTLAAMIEQLAGSTRGSAVVVDGEVVPRSEWRDYALRPGQTVELITAVQGG